MPDKRRSCRLAPLVFLAAAAAWLVPADLAFAARGGLAAVLRQMLDGYELVEATVVPVTAAPRQVDDDQVRATFRVDEIVSAPLGRGPEGGLMAGARFTMLTFVGYGSTFENWEWDQPVGGPADGPLPAGMRFLLTVRPAGDGTYEHAPGTGAAVQVRAAGRPPGTNGRAALRRSDFAQLRAAAAASSDDRRDRCRAWVTDPAVPDALRAEGVRHLVERATQWPYGYLPSWQEVVVSAAERYATAALLCTAFDRGGSGDPAAALSDEALLQIERGLRDTDNQASLWLADTRQRVWFGRLFAPPPAGSFEQARIALLDRPSHVLADLAEADPAAVGTRLAAELTNPTLLVHHRSGLATYLLRLHDTAAAPNPAWATALQAFAADGLDDAADAWDVRSVTWLVGTMTGRKAAGSGRPPPARPIPATPAILAALARAERRLSPLADPAGTRTDLNAWSATDDLRRLLADLDAGPPASRPASPSPRR